MLKRIFLALLLCPVPLFAQAAGNNYCTSSFTGSITTTVLTVTGTPTGQLGVGALVMFSGVTAGTKIVSRGTGVGGAGTYNLNNSQSAGSQAMTTAGVVLGNGWTANKCQLGASFPGTTITSTISPTAGHGVLVGGYVCGDSPCTGTPQATIAIGDNVNSTEGCFSASPNSPHLANSTGAEVRWYWWYCTSIPSGVTSFHITNTNGNFGGALWVFDLTGGTASSPFDADGFNVVTSPATSASVSVTSTNATDLICGMLDRDSGTASDTVTAGYFALMDDGDNGIPGGGTGVMQCQGVAAATTYTITATSTASSTWEAYAVAVKSAAGAATVVPRHHGVIFQ
jgi:hypothetical protein